METIKLKDANLSDETKELTKKVISQVYEAGKNIKFGEEKDKFQNPNLKLTLVMLPDDFEYISEKEIKFKGDLTVSGIYAIEPDKLTLSEKNYVEVLNSHFQGMRVKWEDLDEDTKDAMQISLTKGISEDGSSNENCVMYFNF